MNGMLGRYEFTSVASGNEQFNWHHSCLLTDGRDKVELRGNRKLAMASEL